jgi:FAD-linked sulfhydryl oxidase
MTSIWGPLGWMTIHSMASLYPDTPTQSERQLMVSWLDMFAATITCPSCREHFTELLGSYRQKYPNMLDSRSTFLLFSFRAHNSVNARISKPIYSTVEQCFELLRTNTRTRSATDYRNSYINHIRRFWRTMQDMSGISAMKKIHEMAKIEMSYASPRTNNFEVIIPEDTVVMGRLPPPSGEPVRPVMVPSAIGRFRITGSGIRLQR